jgi:biotin operon repressor
MEYLTEQQTMIYNALRNEVLNAEGLCRKLRINRRELRAEVNDMRKKGVPVISGNYGYALAKSKEEINRTVKRLRSEVNDINEIILALQNAEVMN